MTIADARTQAIARELMDKNFLGLPEAEKHFGSMSPRVVAALAEIPTWMLTTIQDETVRRDCVLVADIGLSVLDVRAKARKGVFSKQDWYRGPGFAHRTNEACWRLIHKSLVPDSTKKNWDEQQTLVAPAGKIPSARIMVYMIVLNLLVTNELLFERVSFRTSDVVSGRYRVSVGGTDANRIILEFLRDGLRLGNVGAASMMSKPS